MPGRNLAANLGLTGAALLLGLGLAWASQRQLWLSHSGDQGAGKHIILIAADQEYRSECFMPMLARLLARHHGFHCTVLFSLNEDNEVDPT